MFNGEKLRVAVKNSPCGLLIISAFPQIAWKSLSQSVIKGRVMLTPRRRRRDRHGACDGNATQD
jgi:hypothetical protein